MTNRDANQVQADAAFDKAIKDGHLSLDESAANYAGDYMFMGVSQDSEHKNVFKHRNTRIKLFI